METKQKSKKITITLPPDMDERFRAYCKKERRTLSGQIQLLIEKELNPKEIECKTEES